MKTLLFISFDEEYVVSVLGTLARKISEEYQLDIITDKDYLTSFFEKQHKIDTLIIDEKIQIDIPSNQAVGRLYVVTETDAIGAYLISKYAGAQGILKILGSGYKRRSRGSVNNGKTRVHDIVSIDDTGIKTIAALTIAGQLVKFGRKVLYLSADNLQDFSYVMKEKDAFSQEEEALILNAVSKGITGDFSKLVKNENFDYIPQFKHLLSSYGMSSATVFQLAEIIKGLEIYDEIVIDHPYGFNADSITRLENSKSVIIITDNKESSDRKLKKLLENTREVGENSLIIYHSDDAADEVHSMYGVNICEKIKDISGGIEELIENKILRDTAEAIL
ncbi:hypothetical protein D6853_15040 [Butyrivibrio sp. X503]|uniref:hypothetical protein n=1 Tax=Butyrivibrio sp. X503 TaxID=2364878 RepID=UPI000EA956EF|nr:hypothetical protein [Butyrivibrio sp. X503]RKM53851.1 hypothetical protein D6853_15040 [Butyrivibrio sp. X503]